jgi:hypothetical protein
MVPHGLWPPGRERAVRTRLASAVSAHAALEDLRSERMRTPRWLDAAIDAVRKPAVPGAAVNPLRPAPSRPRPMPGPGSIPAPGMW